MTHFVPSENKMAERILNFLKFSNTAFAKIHTIGNYNSLTIVLQIPKVMIAGMADFTCTTAKGVF